MSRSLMRLLSRNRRRRSEGWAYNGGIYDFQGAMVGVGIGLDIVTGETGNTIPRLRGLNPSGTGR